MTRYQTILRGENFLIDFNDSVAIRGFFTTVRVDADSTENAELAAVDVLRNGDELLSITRNQPDDSPMIFLEEIFEIDEQEPLDRVGGFTFFQETDEPTKKWWQFWR